jgi:hypothetical protein
MPDENDKFVIQMLWEELNGLIQWYFSKKLLDIEAYQCICCSNFFGF